MSVMSAPWAVDSSMPMGCAPRLAGSIFFDRPDALDGTRHGRIAAVANLADSGDAHRQRGAGGKMHFAVAIDGDLGALAGHFGGVVVADAGDDDLLRPHVAGIDRDVAGSADADFEL